MFISFSRLYNELKATKSVEWINEGSSNIGSGMSIIVVNNSNISRYV